MNAPFSISRRNLLKSTGFLALSFAIPFDAAMAAEEVKLPGDLKNNPMLGAWFRIEAGGKHPKMPSVFGSGNRQRNRPAQGDDCHEDQGSFHGLPSLVLVR